MFKRPHHQRIAKVLEAMNADLLMKMQCFFGGGTAISLQIQEYRESVNIDFLCSSPDGYKELRLIAFEDFNKLFSAPVKRLRDIRIEQNKISTLLDVDGSAIKIELFKEFDPEIRGNFNSLLKVPTLSKVDLYAQKLMANGDRGNDRNVFSRDIIDLAMMLRSWGDIPHEAWNRAYKSYGNQLSRAFHNSVGIILDDGWLTTCLSRMKMDMALLDPVQNVLESMGSRLPLDEREKGIKQQRIQLISTLKNRGLVEHSFWKHASQAIEESDFENMNWAAIENNVIRECLAIEDVSPMEINDIIARYSPGAISPYRQEAILKKIDRLVETMSSEPEAYSEFRPGNKTYL